jgi:CheY-like chemotaxis protein
MPTGPDNFRAAATVLVLVVDDDVAVRELVAAILTRCGYRVLQAADGAEALGILSVQGDAIRLVISDLHMPRLDGFGLMNAMRRSHPSIRGLLISGGSSGPGLAAPGDWSGLADAFLPKPFRAERLLAVVRGLLDA